MSLETALQKNTEAIHALIAALSNGLPQTETEKKKATKQADKAPEEAAPQQDATPSEAAPQETTAPAQPTYAETGEWITKLVDAKGTAAAKGVLSQFDAANLKGVPENQWADVIAACRNILEA